MKYIVETISAHRMVHVVEAANEDEALAIARVADDNWQNYLGELKVDVNEFTDERASYFRSKDYFWEGTSFKDEDGQIRYKDKDGLIR